MKFGVCCAPHALGDPARLLDILAAAGADYVEWTVGSVMSSEAEYEKLLGLVAAGPLKPEAFCVFLPPQHRITGPNVQLPAVLDYCAEAMRRMRGIGADIVVLGSAAARKVPAGFDMDMAHQQFLKFCQELAPLASAADMTVAIEPLNRGEDNLVNTVAEGAAIVDTVALPSIQLLADFYHMVENGEPLEPVKAAGNRLKHTHLADLDRVAPGYSKRGEADFLGFFGALREAGYEARCSFEGKTEDLAAQAKPLLEHMKLRYHEAAANS